MTSGSKARSNAAAPIIKIPMATNARFDLTASANAPPGIWLTTPAIPPTASATPMVPLPNADRPNKMRQMCRTRFGRRREKSSSSPSRDGSLANRGYLMIVSPRDSVRRPRANETGDELPSRAFERLREKKDRSAVSVPDPGCNLHSFFRGLDGCEGSRATVYRNE